MLTMYSVTSVRVLVNGMFSAGIHVVELCKTQSIMPDCTSMSVNGLQYLYTVSRVNLAFDVLYL